jgi:DNA-binding transcriptional MerR regulator
MDLRTSAVAKRAGVSEVTLHRWITAGHVRVEGKASPGSGTARSIPEPEARIACRLAELMRIGFITKHAAPIARRWVESGEPSIDIDGIRLTSQAAIRDYHERMQTLRAVREAEAS